MDTSRLDQIIENLAAVEIPVEPSLYADAATFTAHVADRAAEVQAETHFALKEIARLLREHPTNPVRFNG